MGEIKFFIKVEKNNIVDIKPNANQLTASKPLKEATIQSFIAKMFSETDHKGESLENFKEDLYDSYDDVVDSDAETDVNINNKPKSEGILLISASPANGKTQNISTLVEEAIKNVLSSEKNPPEENPLLISTLMSEENQSKESHISTLVKKALEQKMSEESQSKENQSKENQSEESHISTLVKNALEKELVSKSISALIEHALKKKFFKKE